MRSVWLPAIIAVTAHGFSYADAATFKSTPTRDGKVIVSIQGEIAHGDNDSLRAAITTANNANKVVSSVRLDSIGGNLAEGLRLADTVRTAKVATNVAANAKCASACFLVFAAGADKFANYTAEIGVHGAADEGGNETQGSRSATIGMARASKELGVPAGIIGKMVVTPPDQMVWLNLDDLKSMGVTMVGKPSQLNAPQALSPAQPPMQLGPNISAKKADAWDWSMIVDKAIDLSASQNNGKANIVRSCQPELKICTMAVFYKVRDGTSGFVSLVKDLNEKVVAREVCTLNSFNDIRQCIDYDTSKSTRSMKNAQGNWINVE